MKYCTCGAPIPRHRPYSRHCSQYCADTEQITGLIEEVHRLRGLLTMTADAFDTWEEPTPGAGREWSCEMQTYLRGGVVAQATFEPDEWAELRNFVTQPTEETEA